MLGAQHNSLQHRARSQCMSESQGRSAFDKSSRSLDHVSKSPIFRNLDVDSDCNKQWGGGLIFATVYLRGIFSNQALKVLSQAPLLAPNIIDYRLYNDIIL